MTTLEQRETLGFQTEVTQLLHLVTHSLYSNKEAFLRELISNASDALDRLRFETLGDIALYENDSELKIWVEFDSAAKTITVRDNGIGMTRDDAILNLGTIAKSGTKNFLQALTGDKAKDMHLIGQFGVGFYSSFVVGKKVTVKSRHAGMRQNQGVLWESDGTGEYAVANIEKIERGTEVIVHLKDAEEEFLDRWRLLNIITKYSDHILFPIMMPEEPEKDTKEAATHTPKFSQINKATALWAAPKKDIKEEEYQELYRHISHDFEEALVYSHNHVEGNLDYITLLYIPKHAPFDLWQREKRYGLKLYVLRVFIMDDAENLLPSYLRFVRGLVDSKDLPLNVSREILQSNKIIDTIRSSIIKRVLDMLEKLAENEPEKYAQFWKNFGQVIKEGVAEDSTNKDRIAKLLRFASTKNDTEDQTVSLDDYISLMQPEQDTIFYVTADNYLAAKNSPHLEIFNKKGLEVLLLTDRIDEWLTNSLPEYAGKKLVSVAKGNLDLGKLQDVSEKESQEKSKNEFSSVTKEMQEILKDKVKEVRLTDRLTDSPACLVSDDLEMSLHLQRIFQSSGQKLPSAKPVLELNPEHPLIVRLKNESDVERFKEWSEVIFAQSLLAEGGHLENPGEFVKRLNKLLLEITQ